MNARPRPRLTSIIAAMLLVAALAVPAYASPPVVPGFTSIVDLVVGWFQSVIAPVGEDDNETPPPPAPMAPECIEPECGGADEVAPITDPGG